MKLKVLKPFINKENKEQVFEAGEVIDINDVVRINDIVKRGLGEVIVEQPTGADIDNETPAPTTVVDEKSEEKENEKPKAGRSSRKPKKGDKEVEKQPEEGDADPAPEDGAESEGTETKEE